MPVRFVAIVGAQNEPIYFKSAEGITAEGQMNHQFIAEMSLDFIDQSASQMLQNIRRPMMVVLHDGIAVYALLTNTRTKFIIGLEPTHDNSDVERIINAVVDVFIGYQCNPFGNKEGSISSPQFDEKIIRIIS